MLDEDAEEAQALLPVGGMTPRIHVGEGVRRHALAPDLVKQRREAVGQVEGRALGGEIRPLRQQRMAALHVDAGKAALQRARRLIAPGQHHGGGRRGCGGGEKVAAQHGVSASGEMNLRLRTRTARAAAVETSRGASTSSA